MNPGLAPWATVFRPSGTGHREGKAPAEPESLSAVAVPARQEAGPPAENATRREDLAGPLVWLVMLIASHPNRDREGANRVQLSRAAS